jgi:hypothetical protein
VAARALRPLGSGLRRRCGYSGLFVWMVPHVVTVLVWVLTPTLEAAGTKFGLRLSEILVSSDDHVLSVVMIALRMQIDCSTAP